MFRLEGLEKKHPAQLSGGQQQRVALARILCPSRRRSCSTSPSPRSTAISREPELELSDLLAGFSPDPLGQPRPGGMLPQLPKGLRDGKRRSSPVTDMETLVRHPATQSAYQLTGCRNFLPAHRCGGGVRLDGWDILLPLHAVGERHRLRSRRRDHRGGRDPWRARQPSSAI